MAKVSTTYGTYLSDLFDPEVIGEMINEKLIDNIVFAPLARVDNTLQGRAGDTVTLPYFSYIGDSSAVNEGEDIPLAKLTEKTKTVKVAKIGQGVQITDEAILSGYGDPLNEGVRQIVASIASTVDNMLIDALDTGIETDHVFTPSAKFTVDDIPAALALFGEDIDGQKAIIVDPATYATFLNTKTWIPSTEIGADLLIKGAVGQVYGTQILVSQRIKSKNAFYIVKPDSLAIYSKRDVLVETDRDILNQSTVVVGSKMFAPYLYRPGGAVKIAAGA